MTNGGETGRRIVNRGPYLARQRSRNPRGRVQKPAIWRAAGYLGPGGSDGDISLLAWPDILPHAATGVCELAHKSGAERLARAHRVRETASPARRVAPDRVARS